MNKKVKKISQQKLLYYAEILFKMAFAIHQTGDHGINVKLDYLDTFSWGKHVVHGRDLQLSQKEEELAVALFHHVATYTLANQIDTYLENCFGKERFKHGDDNIRDASIISRLIRNAYTHNPLRPKWLIDRNFRNKTYTVKDIISLDVKNKNGKYVSRYDHGGPLALLRLSEHVRRLNIIEERANT